jgi:hypothetical protein
MIYVKFMQNLERGNRKMKRKIKSTAIALVIIGLAFLYAHIDKNTYLYDRNEDLENYSQTGVLLEGETISQTFFCKEDILDGINLKSVVVGDVSNVILEYAITDNDTGEVIKETIRGTEIKTNKFNQYMLQRIENTSNKSYTLTIKEAGADANNGISFYVSQTNPEDSQLSIREQETQGSLVVRLISHRFDTETFIVLLGFILFITIFIKVLYKLFK